MKNSRLKEQICIISRLWKTNLEKIYKALQKLTLEIPVTLQNLQNVLYLNLTESISLNKWIGTAQKIKFSIRDFFSKCDQIHIFLRI